MGVGSFILIKNEVQWIGPHLASWLPYLDEMSFFDGNSSDGTLEVIERFIERHPHGRKIRLHRGKDCEDLRDNYVRLFDQCMRSLSTDLAMFLHPDMIAHNPKAVANITDGIAYSSAMKSYGGNPGGPLYRIEGRGKAWKHVYRLKNPDLGAHYHGWYGATDEDVYFRSITGDSYKHHGEDFEAYPYSIMDSGLKIMHFSDVRSLARRQGRMRESLRNQGIGEDQINKVIESHPRVTLRPGQGYDFVPEDYPSIFKTWESTLVS